MWVTIRTRTLAARYRGRSRYEADGILSVRDLDLWGSCDQAPRSLRNRDKEVNLHEALGYAHAWIAWSATRLGRLLARERAQGTVEYVALILLVALVMFGVVTAMKAYKSSQGQELGDLILDRIKEAVSKVRY
jgi:hypothetical protein